MCIINKYLSLLTQVADVTRQNEKQLSSFWMLQVLVPGLIPRSISKLDWAGNETTLVLVLLLDDRKKRIVPHCRQRFAPLFLNTRNTRQDCWHLAYQI